MGTTTGMGLFVGMGSENINFSLLDYSTCKTCHAIASEMVPAAVTTPNKEVIFGMDSVQLLTAVIIPFAIAILTVWLTIILRDRLRVKQVAKLSEKKFNELVALYLDRVPDYERVPPDHFKAFFTAKYAASSSRDFRKRVKNNKEPAHLLLIARTSHGLCGFLKAIYVPKVQSLFIAYIVAAKGNTHEERNVTEKLLSQLVKLCKGTDMKDIVCEICADGQTNRHEAKARLFRHYCSANGIKLHRIEAPYKQPEICSFDAGDCNITEANLFIASLRNNGATHQATISKTDYKTLVKSIYHHVYLLSYALAEPDIKDRYNDFLLRVLEAILKSIKSDEIQLR